eukprot:CAMPEP_0184688632 /NCGR_PEP_ID=MMETSP0312-20130426/30206_1 /TAXON_ID=31354 /ORGANISM="Compsopogon coeruleus, Strain SAG 36.94" /LENGTH=68 /DNA_ID=CAMNT_0027145889 /DNA_START=124 /DNA_END=330 /DNA_ORIENTATION=+
MRNGYDLVPIQAPVLVEVNSVEREKGGFEEFQTDTEYSGDFERQWGMIPGRSHFFRGSGEEEGLFHVE